jgi:CRISPR-associated protein Csx17
VINLENKTLGAISAPTGYEYKLSGVRVQPLGNYLAGLGLLRLINRTIDPKAMAFWRAGEFWLQTAIAPDRLVPQLVEAYTALHIINPWNKAAGIAIDGQVATFNGLFAVLQQSPCHRLEGLSALLEDILAVVAANPIVKKETDKPQQVAALKSLVSDSEWLQWCEAAIVEVQKTDKTGKVTAQLKYPALLGTGGNVGPTDLAVNYYEAFSDIFDLKTANGTPSQPAMGMFTEAIFGDATGEPTNREACKGAHLFPANDFYLDFKRSSSLDYVESGGKGGTAVNPALVLLATEGFLTFSSTISTINSTNDSDGVKIRAKTQVAKYSLAVPTKGSSANLVSVSERQNYTEEYFLPLWPMALTHENLKARLFQSPLMNEVGFSMQRKPNDGTDFINEVREWAARTGATGQMLRYTMLPRKGQGNFAVYMGIVDVQGELIDLAADMNPVRGKLRLAADKAPATVSALIYQFDRLYAEFCGGQGGRARLLHLLGTISRHPDVGWCFRDLQLRQDWLAGYEDEVELRLAVALDLKRLAVLLDLKSPDDQLNAASPIGSMVQLLQKCSQANSLQQLDRRIPASLSDIDRFIRGEIDWERFVLWTEALKYIDTSAVGFEPVSSVTARLPMDYRLGLTYIAEFGYASCTFAAHCGQRLMGQGVFSRSGEYPTHYADITLAALLFPVSWPERQIVLKRHFLSS